MTKRRNRGPTRGRYVFLLGAMLAALTVVGARLVYLQVIAAPAYAQQAAEQRTRDIVLSPRRGSVYDREGEPLAVSMEARTIYAVPHSVQDPKGTASALAGILGGDPVDYEARLRKDSSFVYIARKVDMDKAKAVEALDLTGICFLEDSRRTYPSGELACQVLGFVGVDDEGLAGLEQYYDELMSGEPGTVLAERDPYGRPIPGGVMHREDPVHGSDMVLTIDTDIQYQVQVELAEAVTKWGAKSGTAIVMDPRSGEIYAMATVPGFNPNDFGSAEPYTYRNRALTDVYEPGSTMKALTASAVLEEGLFSPDSVLALPSTIEVGGRTIGESHYRPPADWTLTKIVAHSSNVGAVKLGLALGPEGLYEHFARFGMTEKTGVDFPGEGQGYLPPVEKWSGSSIGNIPFGQGVSTTPMQLARAVSAIANGGELVTPHFLLALPDDPDTALSWPKEEAISASTAAQMREVLKAVVTDGTGGNAAVPGYEVAGKTGTAQKARSDGKGYAADKYVGSFIGFLPAEDPQVLILVILDEPSNAIYGGAVAAPTFSKLAQFTVSHLKIPPASEAVTGDSTATVTPRQ